MRSETTRVLSLRCSWQHLHLPDRAAKTDVNPQRHIPNNSNKLLRLESVAETLTGRLDHVTQQLDDLKAALESRGESCSACGPGQATDMLRQHPSTTFTNLSRRIFAHYEPPDQSAAGLRAFPRLLTYPTASYYSRYRPHLANIPGKIRAQLSRSAAS